LTLEGWRIDEHDGLRLVRCQALESVPSVAHAFSTRHGKENDPFDLGSHEASGAEVDARRRRFCEAAGLGGQRATILQQVHGTAVLSVEGSAEAPIGPVADGIVARRDSVAPGLVPAVRWADCVPILLADRFGRCVAAVHAGWRGTAGGIVGQALRALRAQGVGPADLIAALGPAIGGCCYEVGEEVQSAVSRAVGADPKKLVRQGGMLDLRQAVRLQLEREGVGRRSIHVAPWCTRCREDLFFSFRRDGGPSGRQMACIGWPQA